MFYQLPFIAFTFKRYVAVWFFDGARQNGLGDAGMVLFISDSHFFHFKLGCRYCTNTNTELLALWGLLHVVGTLGLPQLTAFGDSKIIVDWMCNKTNL